LAKIVTVSISLYTFNRFTAYLQSYLNSHDYRESLRQCHVPVTVMVGMQSPLYNPLGQMAIADYAPNCKVDTL
jgi:non-heme chloroperoxidase